MIPLLREKTIVIFVYKAFIPVPGLSEYESMNFVYCFQQLASLLNQMKETAFVDVSNASEFYE